MTKIFLDTASADEIREFVSWGIGDGVTTNQKIFLSEGNVDFKTRVLEICGLKEDWPVSVETTTKGFEDRIEEAREYAGWHKNVVVKVAMDKDGVGLQVVKKLHDEGIKTNMTLMVTFNQLYMAAKAGATYVSLFFNRARDAGIDPVRTIGEIMPFLEKQGGSELIVGSIRKPEDVEEVVSASAHIITVTPKVLKQMPFHAKTEETAKEFDDAWKEFVAKNHLVLPARHT
ncbi:MAG TPA: transaldolase family protein [Nitrososphaerales archaeon]|nr:transaldolase family protein [Nitrososphaerales archaeon]